MVVVVVLVVVVGAVPGIERRNKGGRQPSDPDHRLRTGARQSPVMSRVEVGVKIHAVSPPPAV